MESQQYFCPIGNELVSPMYGNGLHPMIQTGSGDGGLPFLTRAIRYQPTPMAVQHAPSCCFGPLQWQDPTFRQDLGPDMSRNLSTSPLYIVTGPVIPPSPYPMLQYGDFQSTPINASPPDSPGFIRGTYLKDQDPNRLGFGITESQYMPYNVAVIDELMHLVGQPIVNPNIAPGHQTFDYAQGNGLTDMIGTGRNCNAFPILTSPPKLKKQDDYFCAFCRANNETEKLWRSHRTHERGLTTCPILKKYTCPICGETGERSHTIKYCPKNDGAYAGHVHVITGRNAAGLITKKHFGKK